MNGAEHYERFGTALAEERKRLIAENERLRAGIKQVRAYNVDIVAGRIHYRPHDHIAVLDRALQL